MLLGVWRVVENQTRQGYINVVLSADGSSWWRGNLLPALPCPTTAGNNREKIEGKQIEARDWGVIDEPKQKFYKGTKAIVGS